MYSVLTYITLSSPNVLVLAVSLAQFVVVVVSDGYRS